MSLTVMIIAIVGGIAGLLSTLYLVCSLPAVIIWKLWRRIFHGIPMTK
ncbi:MAG: hypothetical protein J6C84_10245 [Lachnospiraceae bacterium]|nr:hypothetical protein [Lachnospiraceae bacterium]